MSVGEQRPAAERFRAKAMLQREFQTALIASCLLCGCFVPAGGGESPFDEDPRELIEEPAPVAVEVERVGLEGFAGPDGPTVIEYRLINRKAAGSFALELLEWPPPAHTPIEMTVSANVAPLPIELGAGEELSGRWIVPSSLGFQWMDVGGSSELLLLARGEGGELLGATALPDIRRGNRTLAVIAADAETGLEIKQEIDRVEIGASGGVFDHDVALLLEETPDLWHEYTAARAVLLARPWADLSEAERRALRRYTALGGVLLAMPEHCPDWRDAEPLAAARPGMVATRYGAGRVHVEPLGAAGAASRRQEWLLRALPGAVEGSSIWRSSGPPLFSGYVMPDAVLLTGLIVLIVLIVGPVLHLVLSRLRRREWAWVAVPVSSVLLAGCMYAAACGVKGEKSVLEVHHLVWSFGDAREAAVHSSIRVLSSEAGLRSVEAKGDSPRPSDLPSWPFVRGGSPRAVRVEPERVAVEGLPMHRFSSNDLQLVFAGEPVSIRLLPLGENGVRIDNRSGAELTDLYLWRPGGWVELADRLGAGETLERRSLGRGVSAVSMLPEGSARDSDSGRLVSLLQAARPGRVALGREMTALVAGCDPPGLPRVSLRPEPLVERERATCVWWEPAFPPLAEVAR
ncbi:MAG: hypothetical protein R6V85_03790 [Polyangia bacterium]